MPNITLKATLQAYSKAPFYGDYVRQPSSVLENYDPELVYVLKDGTWIDLAEASSNLGLSIETLAQEIARVERELSEDIRTIRCYIDYDRQGIVFIDSNNQEFFYTLPAAVVDWDSIGLNNKNEITALDKPDGKSIKVVDVEYDNDGVVVRKKSAKLRVDALYNEALQTYISGKDIETRLDKAEKNIKDLESYTQGTGGFLDPYNFGKALGNLDEIEKNSLLNQEAYNQLSSGEPSLLPDQTKIKNIFDGHIWVYIQETDDWIDEGADTVVTANNDGVLGSVTGVTYDPNNQNTKFKIAIGTDVLGNSTGVMEVNGLKEEFTKVIYKTETDVEETPDTYALRTDTGAIKAAQAENDDEVINQGQFNAWLNSMIISDAEIESIVNDNYIPVTNNGGNN